MLSFFSINWLIIDVFVFSLIFLLRFFWFWFKPANYKLQTKTTTTNENNNNNKREQQQQTKATTTTKNILFFFIRIHLIIIFCCCCCCRWYLMTQKQKSNPFWNAKKEGKKWTKNECKIRSNNSRIMPECLFVFRFFFFFSWI